MPEVSKEYQAIDSLRPFHASDARSRMLVGPFRSGKSVAAVVELLQMAQEMPVDRIPASSIQDGIICRTICVRKTYRMLLDSVIKTFFQWIPKGVAGAKWREQDLSFLFPLGNGYFWEVLFRSADTAEDIEKFKGVEISSYWIDEAVEVSQDVKLILEGRMSYPAGCPIEYFRSILTTNPCDSEHWLYRDYVSNPLPGHVYWRQGARENPHLTKEYYDQLEQMYVGRPEILRRYIHGEWGAIFSGKPVYGQEFNHDFHVSRDHLKAIPGIEIACGWDYGLTPAFVATQINPDGRWMILRELYSDDMSIDEFGDLVVDFCNREWPGWTFRDVGDPAGRQRAQTDEKSCMDILRAKRRNVRAAGTNALIPRLEAVKRMLTKTSKGQSRVVIDPRCKRLIDGFTGGYRYVERANTGMHADTPEKNLYSHCLAAGTMVSTPAGEIPIESLKIGDLVDTPIGPRRVIANMSRKVYQHIRLELSTSRVIYSTLDHPFYTAKSIVRADELRYNDSLVGMKTKEDQKWAGRISTGLLSLKESGIITNQAGILSRIFTSMAESICTALCGHPLMDQSQKIVPFTTSTGINQTIALGTFNYMPLEYTRNYTQYGIIETFRSGCCEVSRLLKSRRKSGTDRKMEEDGIGNTGKGLGREGRKNCSYAHSAGKSIGRIVQRAKEVFAGRTARINNEGVMVSGSTQINEPITVYDITVQDAHCFYAEGVLVSNCHDALQYVAMDLFGYAERNTQLWKEPLNVRGIINS